MENYLNENLGPVKARHSSEEASQRWREARRTATLRKRTFPGHFYLREEAGNLSDPKEAGNLSVRQEAGNLSLYEAALLRVNQWLQILLTMARVISLLSDAWKAVLLAYEFILKFLKDTWTKCKEIFTINRIAALIAFGLEAASAVLEQISKEGTDEPTHPKLYIIALLAALFSLISLLLAVFEMMREVPRANKLVDLKVECLNVSLALVQTISSLLQFILVQFCHTKYPIRFSFVPLIFALIVLILSFISHRTDTIKCRLVPSNS